MTENNLANLIKENAIKYVNSRIDYWRIADSQVLQAALSNKILSKKFITYTFEGSYNRIVSANERGAIYQTDKYGFLRGDLGNNPQSLLNCQDV